MVEKTVRLFQLSKHVACLDVAAKVLQKFLVEGFVRTISCHIQTIMESRMMCFRCAKHSVKQRILGDLGILWCKILAPVSAVCPTYNTNQQTEILHSFVGLPTSFAAYSWDVWGIQQDLVWGITAELICYMLDQSVSNSGGFFMVAILWESNPLSGSISAVLRLP